mgnify:CR=1 FL=1
MIRASIKDLMDFIDKSPSPFHVVNNTINRLKSNGFQQLKESECWDVKAGGAYYVERSSSSIIAFRIPNKKTDNTIFNIVHLYTHSIIYVNCEKIFF